VHPIVVIGMAALIGIGITAIYTAMEQQAELGEIQRAMLEKQGQAAQGGPAGGFLEAEYDQEGTITIVNHGNKPVSVIQYRQTIDNLHKTEWAANHSVPAGPAHKISFTPPVNMTASLVKSYNLTTTDNALYRGLTQDGTVFVLRPEVIQQPITIVTGGGDGPPTRTINPIKLGSGTGGTATASMPDSDTKYWQVDAETICRTPNNCNYLRNGTEYQCDAYKEEIIRENPFQTGGVWDGGTIPSHSTIKSDNALWRSGKLPNLSTGPLCKTVGDPQDRLKHYANDMVLWNADWDVNAKFEKRIDWDDGKTETGRLQSNAQINGTIKHTFDATGVTLTHFFPNTWDEIDMCFHFDGKDNIATYPTIIQWFGVDPEIHITIKTTNVDAATTKVTTIPSIFDRHNANFNFRVDLSETDVTAVYDGGRKCKLTYDGDITINYKFTDLEYETCGIRCYTYMSMPFNTTATSNEFNTRPTTVDLTYSFLFDEFDSYLLHKGKPDDHQWRHKEIQTSFTIPDTMSLEFIKSP